MVRTCFQVFDWNSGGCVQTSEWRTNFPPSTRLPPGMHAIREYIEYVALFFEVAGVAVMVVGFCYALYRAFRPGGRDTYTALRQNVGKAILLGLEILVAADIIITVTTEPTIDRLLGLGLVVLIRTFLSFSLEVELDGRWPWQQADVAEARGQTHEVLGGHDST